MATHTGHVMNLANSIIGVSLLAMPFCFKQCGITLAIVMLMLSSMISRLACHFLVKSSTMCRRRNFEFLAFYTFGPSGKLLVELGVIGFMMGTCVAFFVVMGDLGPAIISKIFNISNNGTLRTSVLIGLGLFVVLPLGLLRNVESLAAISTVTIGFYFLFILKIFFESSPHLLNGDWWYHVNFWQTEGILQCIPIFAMALSCQTQLFEIYDSLPNPTIDKMNGVVHSALNLCTVVYASVGLLGYIAYYKGNFTGNILLSFTPSLSSEMFKLGFVLSIAVSFPLVIFPCRASLFSLIFRRVPIHHELSQTSSHIPDSRFKCLTIGIVSVALITGLLIPSIELVLGFVGSTIGIAICVIFPSLAFLYLNEKNTNERLIAKMTLLVGLIIMITGTFGNLFAAVDKSIESNTGKLIMSKNLPQINLPPIIVLSTESSPKSNKEVLRNLIPLEKLPLKKSDEIKPKIKIVEGNRRKEPPVPVAPAPIKKENAPPPVLAQVPQTQFLVTKKAMENNEEPPKEVEPEQKKLEPVPDSKQSEVINKDAIEKEERELMEMEKQKKTEEDKKQEELLIRLKKHQDEQKKLLQEQEKILKEIKTRESEKKLKEITEVKPIPKDSNILKEEVKAIKAEDFKANLNEIQNIIDNLKDTKSSIDKEKTERKIDDKNNTVKNQSSNIERSQNAIAKEKAEEVKNSIVSMPLPLAKLNMPLEVQKEQISEKELPQLKQEVLSRDILIEQKKDVLDREKRNVESEKAPVKEECTSKEKEKDKKTEIEAANNFSENKSPKPVESLIKNSEVLSVGMSEEKKKDLNDAKTSKLIPDIVSQPLISKKRDLKSVNNL